MAPAKARVKNALELVSKGQHQASVGEAEGPYRFFSSSSKVMYSNECDFDGEHIIVGTGGKFNFHLYNGKFASSSDTLVYRVANIYHGKYMYYWLSAQGPAIQEEAFSGMGIEHLNRQVFHDFDVPLPPLEEQKRIADYLDAKTATIDALLAELAKFKELLKQRDQALISECVTKGIPERRAVDLTVSWLPARLGSICESINGFAFKPEHLDGSITPVIRIRQLLDKAVEPDKTDIEIPERYMLSDGDLVFSWSATIAVRIWDRGPAALNQHLFRVIPDSKYVSSRFLYYSLQRAIEHFSTISHGSTMQHLTRDMYEGYRLLLPSKEIQQEISEYLDVEQRISNSLLGEVNEQVQYLEALRQAMITKEVTGVQC